MVNLKKKLNLNLRPDKIDSRDYQFKDFPTRLVKLPKKIDLRKRHNPARDQSNIGSCFGCAGASAVEFLYSLRSGFKWKVNLSPLDLYYYARKAIEKEKVDFGCYPRDGCKVLQKRGIAMEWFWPYRTERFGDEPGFGADISAGFFKVDSYWRAYSIQEIKQALALNQSVIIGAKIFSNITSSWLDGEVKMPGPEDKCAGSHALVCVGYNDYTKKLIFKNSWGFWGENGYGTFPYEYLPHIHDIWILT